MTVDTKVSPVGIVAAGIEKNIGDVFVRAEAEITVHSAGWLAQSITLPLLTSRRAIVFDAGL
jgi:hypothetical protein